MFIITYSDRYVQLPLDKRTCRYACGFYWWDLNRRAGANMLITLTAMVQGEQSFIIYRKIHPQLIHRTSNTRSGRVLLVQVKNEKAHLCVRRLISVCYKYPRPLDGNHPAVKLIRSLS